MYSKRIKLLWAAFPSKNVVSVDIFSEMCTEQTLDAQIFASIFAYDTLILKSRARGCRYFRLNLGKNFIISECVSSRALTRESLASITRQVSSRRRNLAMFTSRQIIIIAILYFVVILRHLISARFCLLIS